MRRHQADREQIAQPRLQRRRRLNGARSPRSPSMRVGLAVVERLAFAGIRSSQRRRIGVLPSPQAIEQIHGRGSFALTLDLRRHGP